jgi:DNA processing protein
VARNAPLLDGAALVRGAGDVLAELGLAAPRAEAEAPPDGLLATLMRGVPAGVDEIQTRTGLALPELLAWLSELELDGAVERLPGAQFVRR